MSKNACVTQFVVIHLFLSLPTRSLFIFPQAGPDIKYLLGFVRTQLSTTTTIILVFGPKILRVLRGQGDKWDQRARARGITASFCINGGGLMPDEGVDLYQENEELKVRLTSVAISFQCHSRTHVCLAGTNSKARRTD